MSNSTLAVVSLAHLTKAEERALSLLGQGVIPEQAAAASGLSPSRISQLLSQEDFASRVAELRFESLSKHNERDAAYDSLEDDLIEKMRDCLPLMVRPQEILRAISVINAAKRRGASAPESITNQSTVINLVLPNQILTKFTLNQSNQVVQAGDQPLVTIQSGTLLNQMKEKTAQPAQLEEIKDVLTKPAKVFSNPRRQITAEDF